MIYIETRANFERFGVYLRALKYDREHPPEAIPKYYSLKSGRKGYTASGLLKSKLLGQKMVSGIPPGNAWHG